jgi:hypothetical protein
MEDRRALVFGEETVARWRDGAATAAITRITIFTRPRLAVASV